MLHSAAYRELLESDLWKERSRMLREEVGRCERCGAVGRLEVHHRSYDRLGEERREDLEVLCHPCHRAADGDREARASNRRWSRRVDGYASKRWGEDWQAWVSYEDASEALDDWIQRSEGSW